MSLHVQAPFFFVPKIARKRQESHKFLLLCKNFINSLKDDEFYPNIVANFMRCFIYKLGSMGFKTFFSEALGSVRENNNELYHYLHFIMLINFPDYLNCVSI